MNKPILSIIVVNWNGLKWLKKCLDSLKDQDYKNFETILIDNSSTDKSLDFVQKKYPHIKTHNSPNRGFGYACNLGAKIAQGKFLMFFNEDMYVDKNFVTTYLNEYKKIKNKKRIGTVGCAIADYDKSKIISSEMYGYSIDFMSAPVPNFNTNRIFHNTGCPLFISKNLFNKIGGFCQNIFLYGEDIDICWRLNIYGYKHYFLQNVYIYHNCAVGSFSERKLALYIRGEINCLLNNYSTPLLVVGITYFLTFYICLSILYLILGRLSFLKTIYCTIINELKNNYHQMLDFRKIIQKTRTVTDFSMVKYINLIPSRFLSLYYTKQYRQSKTESYLLKHLLKIGK